MLEGKLSPHTKTIHVLQGVLSFISWPSPSQPRFVSARLAPYSLDNLFSPDGRSTIDFAFRDDILEIKKIGSKIEFWTRHNTLINPIFRRATVELLKILLDQSSADEGGSSSFLRSSQKVNPQPSNRIHLCFSPI